MTADELAATIADRLGETEDLPRRQIRRAVRAFGEERARALLAETLAIEAAGGELLPDGRRRRTPGGIFFRLVRGAASREEYAAIFWAGGDGRRQAAVPPFT